MKVKIRTRQSVITGGVWFILGIWWCAGCSTPSALPIQSPPSRKIESVSLSVYAFVYDDSTKTESHELWHVDFEKNPFEPQRILTSTTWIALVECDPPDVLCVKRTSDASATLDLQRWQVDTTAWPEIMSTVIMTSPMNILASSSNGAWLASCHFGGDNCWLYFQAYGQPIATTVTNYSNIYCNDRLQLSPTGEYAALQCWGKEWMKQSADYLSPVGQHFRLINADGSDEYLLTLPTTYFFYDAYLCCSQPIAPRPPAFAWSPDGTELAFVAAFSPPITLTDGGTPQSNAGLSYKSFGGIYSISLEDKTISEWAQVGGSNVPLAWSPDGKEIAYAKQGIVYVASRNGSQRQIGSLDAIKSILWSPDGAYLAVQGIDWSIGRKQLWIISLSDGVWHRLDLRGQVIDMQWNTLYAP